VFRDPNIRRFLAARFLIRVGGEAAFFVGVWGRAAYELDAGPTDLAILMTAFGVAGLIGSAASGVLVDRFGPKRILVASAALGAPLALSLVWIDAMAPFVAVVCAAALIAAAGLTATTSMPRYLAIEPSGLVRVNAGLEQAGSLSFVVGPAIGGVLVVLGGIDAVFLFEAALTLVAALLYRTVVLHRATPQPTAAGDRSALRELREGFGFAYRQVPLRFALLLATASFVTFGVFGGLEPLFFRDVLAVGPEALGWVNALFGIGLLAGAMLFDRLPARLVSARLLTALSAGGGLGIVAYVATADLRFVVAGGILWGAVLGMLLPVLRTYLQLHTPERLTGRVMGVLQVHNSGGELLPLPALPLLAAVWGVQPVLVATGILLLVGCLACLSLAAALDRRESDVPAEPACTLP
jgi:MFS transporter, DHA3 family, macrolide efflux protein